MRFNYVVPTPLQEPPDFSLVLGGPLYQMLRRAHLTGPALELPRRRIVKSVLLCWVRWQYVPEQAHLLRSKVPFFAVSRRTVRTCSFRSCQSSLAEMMHQRIRPVCENVGTVMSSPREDFRILCCDRLRMRYTQLQSFVRSCSSILCHRGIGSGGIIAAGVCKLVRLTGVGEMRLYMRGMVCGCQHTHLPVSSCCAGICDSDLVWFL